MAEQGKLYITITDKRDGDGNTPTPNPSDKTEKEKENALGRYAEHQLFNLVKSQATKFVNYQIANIGNFTGDYIRQQQVNEMKQAVSGIMTISIATIAGAKYGPWGAAIGFAIGAGSLLVDSVYSVYTQNFENKKTNYEIAQLRNRSGLNTILDGSRGTEN